MNLCCDALCSKIFTLPKGVRVQTIASRLAPLFVIGLLAFNTGCTSWREYFNNGFKVGPNYCRPAAPVRFMSAALWQKPHLKLQPVRKKTAASLPGKSTIEAFWSTP